MDCASSFYDISGQIERTRQINKRIIDLHRGDIDENFRPIGKKWPYFEVLTGCGPFTPFFSALVRNKSALTQTEFAIENIGG